MAASLLLCATIARADVEYDVDIKLEGLDNSALLQTLRDASQLVTLKNKPPPSADALRRRAANDLPRLNQIMQAEGYWTAKLSYILNTNEKPPKVTIDIEPGPLFHLASVTFKGPSGEPLPLLDKLGPAAFGLAIGQPARSAPVTAAEPLLAARYERDGHPFAKVTDRHVVVDVAKDTMSVTYAVDPGPPARFGPLTIEGLKNVDQDFVARRVAWHQGAPYDVREVEATRQELVKAGLFSAVHITHAAAPDSAGEVPMTITLVEGPPRSIGAGVAYNTNLGFGGQAFWEHRNLFGEGERLQLTAGAAQRQLGLALAFRKPDFIDRHQDFLTNAGLLQENTDAYNSRRAQIFIGIERPLLPSLITDAGIDLERATVREFALNEGNENYTLFGLPFVLRRDTTDDLLDPTVGSRETLTLTPYHSIAGPSLNFLTSRLELRRYLRLDETGRMVLAGFGAFGSIEGPSRDMLPADKRLYAGGAGSVRGYAYQHAGPLDAAGVPVGGKSSIEVSGEFRYRITETIGIVPFVDGGNVYPSSLPNNSSLFWGAGIGLRYYTVIGPVRLDLATPFTHRPGDTPIQVYISIGQAF